MGALFISVMLTQSQSFNIDTSTHLASQVIEAKCCILINPSECVMVLSDNTMFSGFNDCPFRFQ